MNETSIGKQLMKWLRKKKFVPNANPIKMATIYKVYYRIGSPKLDQISKFKMEVAMRSGKTAIYLLDDWEPAMGDVDWHWLIFEFDGYKNPNDKKEYPKYE